MKTLLTSTALAAMLATGAAAFTAGTTNNEIYWKGNTDNLTAECTFTDNVDGAMSWNETNGVWTTDTGAFVTVTARNGNGTGDVRIGSIVLEPVDSDGSSAKGEVHSQDAFGNVIDSWEADVNYYDGTLDTTTPGGWTLAVTDNSVGTSDKATWTDNNSTNGNSANLTSAKWTIKIAGTATPTLGTNEILDANTDFVVRHRITCFQDTLQVN